VRSEVLTVVLLKIHVLRVKQNTLLDLLYPAYESTRIFQNVTNYLLAGTVQQPRRLESKFITLTYVKIYGKILRKRKAQNIMGSYGTFIYVIIGTSCLYFVIDFSADGLTGQNTTRKNNVDVLLYCLCPLLAFTGPLPFKLSHAYQVLSNVLIKDATKKCMNVWYNETKKVALCLRK
jgi:hypothetical protein